MTQTVDHPITQTQLHLDHLVLPEFHHRSEKRCLSDREAVIAVMVANGRTRQDIASELSLAPQTVEGHLYRALEILGLSGVEDLSFTIVASHYNRTHSTEPGAPRRVVSNTHRMTTDPADYQQAPRGPAPGFLSTAGAGNHRSSLALLDEAEAAQAANQELAVSFDLGIELVATRARLAQEHETVKQLHEAVRSRDTIGQAKGILMERHKISVDAAFAVLREESSRSNRKLVHVAEQLIYTGRQETH